MPKAILKFKEQVIREYNISYNQPLYIGRNPTNNIVIDNLSVSGSHARIFLHKKGFVISDLESKNGTFVKNKRIKNYLLKHDDIITIGKHQIVFDLKKESDDLETKGDLDFDSVGLINADQTMMIDISRNETLGGKTKLETIAILTFLNSKTKPLEIRKNVTTIGTSIDSDIVVKGYLSFLIGKTAASISRGTDKSFTLRYVKGLIKPRVNNKKIVASVQLIDKDIIVLGPLKFQISLGTKTAV